MTTEIKNKITEEALRLYPHDDGMNKIDRDRFLDGAKYCYAICQSTIDEKGKRIDELMNFARSVREWELPETGKFWDEEKTRPTSYETEYGSKGVRDYFRNKAAKIIQKIISDNL